ncbi:hypothetical protein L1887_15004 [Cichorium endivia]|nr:hypothetical protein L1887_15004 [Cichorium endivia]
MYFVAGVWRVVVFGAVFLRACLQIDGREREDRAVRDRRNQRKEGGVGKQSKEEIEKERSRRWLISLKNEVLTDFSFFSDRLPLLLVLTIIVPDVGINWFALTVLSPLAQHHERSRLISPEISPAGRQEGGRYDRKSKRFLKKGVKEVLVKLGGRGSALFTEGKEPIIQSIIEAKKVIDTIGAGDTFTAVYAVAFVEGKSKVDCLKFADVELGKFSTLKLNDKSFMEDESRRLELHEVHWGPNPISNSFKEDVPEIKR